MDLVDATLLLDVMGTGGHAVERAQRMRPDIESAVVAGAGPIGLGLVAMLKILLGDDVPVYATDLSPYRLGLAEAPGATPVGSVADARRPDVAFDATGREEVRRQLLDGLAQRGVLVCVGHGKGLALKVTPDLIAAERCVMGSEYFRFDELPANVTLLGDHLHRLRAIITHRFPVADITEGFEAFMSGETGKAVVLP